MPSARHQALARLLTERPEVLLALLRRLLGLEFPDDAEVHQGPETIRSFGDEDYHPDGQVVVLSRAEPMRNESFVVEVQHAPKPQKLRRWPTYVTGSEDRLGYSTSLVVFTESIEVARWASRPIRTGRGRSTLVPYVIGPEQIPEHMDRDEALRVPALAVLSVVGHGRGPGAERIGRLAIEAVRSMTERGDDDGMLYMDVIAAFLDEDVMVRISEDEMSARIQEPISQFAKHHRDLGLEQGLDIGLADAFSRSLLATIEARELELTDVERSRIAGCADPAVLERWFLRALTAEHPRQIFGT